MQYAFVLGRVYTLSLAELLVVLGSLDSTVKLIEASLEVVIVDVEKPLDVQKLQSRLGGIIKILKIVETRKKREQDSINFALQNYFKPSKLKSDFLTQNKGKIQFGVSIYLLDVSLAKKPGFIPGSTKPGPPSVFSEPKRIGMFIKRAMADSGSSIRLVLPEFNSLSLASVSVTKNLLLEKGAEICILPGATVVYVAKTLSVQGFEDYGRRDYQRPVRDEVRGMIPPKVAQSMLNLSGVKSGEVILDPFCGIGTIMQEGMLLGYKTLGTDIDKLAINGADKNLEWFRNRYKIPKGKYHIEVSDAKQVGTIVTNLIKLKAITNVSAIVTEGTLGPIYSNYPKDHDIEKNFEELQNLYFDCFSEFSKFLINKGKIVICLPAYRKSSSEYRTISNIDFATKNGYTIKDVIPKAVASKLDFIKMTSRGTVIYDRKDQIVAREIVIFEKI